MVGAVPDLGQLLDQGRRRAGDELLVVLPGLLVAGVLAAWAADGGGFSPLTWYPGAILLLALLAVAWTGGGVLWRRSHGAGRASIVLFAAFTVWSFASIAWAGDRGAAWDGANRTLLYLVVYLVAARWRWSIGAAATTLGAIAVGFAAVGLVTLWQVAHSAAPQSFFIGSRLVAPTGYPNATAALYLLAFWPALCLGSRREVPRAVRGLALGLAGLLLQLSLIPESRGALLSLPVVLVLYFALVPGRGRSLLAVGVVAVPTALTLPRLLGVYRTVDAGGDIRQAVRGAAAAMAIAFVCTSAAGFLLAAVDRRLELRESVVARINVALAGTATALAVTAVVACVALFGSPAGSAAVAWRSFKSESEPQGSSHFTGLGSHRYDFWRVAFEDFRAHPLGGVGADNFAASYLRDRRSGEEPLYPHSIELRLLGQTGAVGTLLLSGSLAAAGALFVRRRRKVPPLAAALAGAALTALGYWLFHGSGDWLWEFPALGAAAFACLGISTSLVAPDDRVPAPRRTQPARRAAFALAFAAALLSFAAPWAAARDVAAAEAGWRTDPAGAFARLHRAAMLDPLSDQADVAAGVIATQLGDRRRASEAFGRAVRRNPSNWFAWLELGVSDAGLNDGMGGARSLAMAVALDPRDPVVRLVARSIASGTHVSQRKIDRLLIQRTQRAIGEAG
ncbi:MAG TPA: O-antigen ligase family protein [Gaiellaceae bacterium]|jgi:hypothetical protein